MAVLGLSCGMWDLCVAVLGLPSSCGAWAQQMQHSGLVARRHLRS